MRRFYLEVMLLRNFIENTSHWRYRILYLFCKFSTYVGCDTFADFTLRMQKYNVALHHVIRRFEKDLDLHKRQIGWLNNKG